MRQAKVAAFLISALLTACSPSGGPSSPSVPSTSGVLPSTFVGHMPAATFRRHLTELVLKTSPIVSRIADATGPRDRDTLRSAATDLYAVMREDEKWQRANVSAILGNCYDAAVNDYSGGWVSMEGGATAILDYVSSGAEARLGYGASLLQDGAREFQAADNRLAGLDC